MKRFFVVLSLLFCCFFFEASAEQNKGRVYADSVLNELGKVEGDTLKLLLYETLAGEFNDLNMDSALLFGQLYLQQAQKMKWVDFTAYAYQSIGFTNALLTMYDTALAYYNKAYKIYKQKGDSLGLADVYLNMSRTYAADNQLSKGLLYAFKTLSIYEQYDELAPNLISIYTEVADMYSGADEEDKAMIYYRKALVLSEKEADDYEAAYLLLSLGSQYLKLEKVDSALYYSEKAKLLFEKINNDFNRAYALDNIAEVYLLKGMYKEALANFEESGVFFRSTNDRAVIAVNLYNIGKVYLHVAEDTTGYPIDAKVFAKNRRGNYTVAIKKLEQAKDIYTKELNRTLELVDINKLLSVAYEGIGMPSRALSLYKEYLVIDDSIKKQNESKKVAELDAQRKLSLKDKELELQRLLIVKKRNERGFLVGGILLLLGGLLIVFKSYRERGKINKQLAIEKNKSEELLLNILPEEVASELKEKGSADAMYFDEVTVLFTDFVNFTEAGERMTSQELVDELHACFKAFDEIAEKYDIEKIKTIGDAYLAVCGLPTANKLHAENIVKTAQEIRDFMLKRRSEIGNKTFEIRIGVHTGEVVAGIVGVKKFAYDIWGDTVNTAARMEHYSEPGKINISQSTYELVRDKFACLYRGELEAKHKGKLKMYFVKD
ncbi:MAG: adenylate/guanylate cyclase domain-containing protein [Flavipsychrobacter sp.]